MFFNRQKKVIQAKSEAVLLASHLVNMQAKALREIFELTTRRLSVISTKIAEFKALNAADADITDAMRDEAISLLEEKKSLESSTQLIKFIVVRLVNHKRILLSHENATIIKHMNIDDIFSAPFNHFITTSCVGPMAFEAQKLQASFARMQRQVKTASNSVMKLSLAMLMLRTILVVTLAFALTIAATSALAALHIVLPPLVMSLCSFIFMLSVVIKNALITAKQFQHDLDGLDQPIDTSNLAQNFDELDELIREMNNVDELEMECDTSSHFRLTA
jgi:hypothetical protein